MHTHARTHACCMLPVGMKSSRNRNSSSSSSPNTGEEWKELLERFLGKDEGAAVAASLARHEVAINVTDPDGEPLEEEDGDTGAAATAPAGTQKPPLVQCHQGCPCVKAAETIVTASSSKHDDAVFTEASSDSVLHVVAAAGDSDGHLECAKEIHRKESRLLTTAACSNINGDTPLHCAARAGNTRMVALLMELAAGNSNSNSKDDDDGKAFVRARNYKLGETVLHEAVRFGHLKMVEALVNKDPELARINAKDGTSPLYLACSMGHGKIVRRLLKEEEAEEPSYSGPRGQNALHAAVLDRKKDMTKWLLQRNKDLVREKDMDGSTPLHFAASAQDLVVQYTLFAFSVSNLEFITLGLCLPHWILTKVLEWTKHPLPQLLDADPTSAFQPDNHGSLPVHVAASAGSMVPLIVLLTRYPGCAGSRDADGRTFLHVAVEKKRLNVVRYVCRLWRVRPFARSVVNVQDKNGDTALHLAVRMGELDISRYLMQSKDTHINLQNSRGRTPMDLATGGVQSGFYFGLTARRRILGMLSFAEALSGNRRRDRMPEYSVRLDEAMESEKIKDFAQIVGIGSVLVATATFAAAVAMPGGVWSPGDAKDATPVVPPPGTPVLNGSYAFQGFVVANTMAFMCSTLATFILVYCGVAAVDISKRIELVAYSLALLLCSARSFCAAFAFSLYLLLGQVAYGTAVAACVMTSLALLDWIWFLMASYNDTTAFVRRKTTLTFLRLGIGFIVNFLYLFWPYFVIAGYLLVKFLRAGKFHGLTTHH